MAALAASRTGLQPLSGTGAAALVPLFYAALLFLAGIVLAHFVYLQPGWLLAGVLALGLVAAWAIWKTPRVAWVALAALWLALGAWSAETEPASAASPEVTSLADGLLRTVEGTVTASGSLHGAETDEEPDAAEDAEGAAERLGQTQRVDLRLTAAEVVTDDGDAVLPIAAAAGVRLTVRWPGAAGVTLKCGQGVRVVVRMLPPEVFHDPGVWSRAAYLEGQGIAASGTVNGADSSRFAVLEGRPRRSVACLLN